MHPASPRAWRARTARSHSPMGPRAGSADRLRLRPCCRGMWRLSRAAARSGRRDRRFRSGTGSSRRAPGIPPALPALLAPGWFKIEPKVVPDQRGELRSGVHFHLEAEPVAVEVDRLVGVGNDVSNGCHAKVSELSPPAASHATPSRRPPLPPTRQRARLDRRRNAGRRRRDAAEPIGWPERQAGR